MKKTYQTKFSLFNLGLVALSFLAATASSPAQTQPCVETNGVKYLQPPNPTGFDVLNTGPWVLADDFICTNSGPISDIHIWGSWLSDNHGTITNFWLGIYDDVPVNPNNPNSHPGNLLWSESFPAGQFAETSVGPSQEKFLDPGPGVIIGTDTNIWYYCFYPTNPFVQTGSNTASKIYWLAAYAQVSTVAGANSQYGWKTTFIVQNDTSVHEPWPGSLPGTNSNWLPTIYQTPAGGQVPLDLAFMLTTPTNSSPCLDFVCPSNLVLYMPCGFSCVSVSNYPPAFATNYCSPFAGVRVTYNPPPGFCFPLGTTPVTMTVSGSGETSNCTFSVTVLNNPNCPPTNNPPCLDFVCPTNMVLSIPCDTPCLTGFGFQPVFATNYCNPAAGVTVTYNPPPGCFPQGTTLVTMTVSGSGQTNSCTFTVTIVPYGCPSNPPPVVCVESDYGKYVQGPNTLGGFDVWNNPYVLADDFVCTNTSPISDIHLWGSWLSDNYLTNSITFWLGIYNDVPAVTNLASGQVTPSHPGTNLMWQQWFNPGQYAETIWTANASEQFLDPGQTNILGTDSEVWYYCFYPTNAFEQRGTPTNSKTYWLAAYAQLPAGIPYKYGWKTTTNVQNDVSVHAFWPGFAPTNNPGWMPTVFQPPTGGPSVRLDLAFKLTMCGPVFINRLAPTNVVVTWPGGGYLQSATNVAGPYVDVPLNPPSPFTDYSVTPSNKFYRLRCY